MSQWICNNCNAKFEGGLFNLRECPGCHRPVREFMKFVWFLVKVALVAVPALFLLRLFKFDIYQNVAQTVENVLDLNTAVYFSPSLYFNNIVFIRGKTYYTLRGTMPLYDRISPVTTHSQTADALKPGQNVLVRGFIPSGDSAWAAVEYYSGENRRRMYLLTVKNWDSVFSWVDYKAVMNRAKSAFRNAVLSALPYRKVSGKEAIVKFRELNPEYERLDIEDTSFLKPLFSFLNPQQVDFFVKKEHRPRVEELRRTILDKTVIEKELLKQK